MNSQLHPHVLTVEDAFQEGNHESNSFARKGKSMKQRFGKLIEDAVASWLIQRQVLDPADYERSVVKAMTREEAERYREAELRRRCGWFQWYQISMFFSFYCIQGIPFNLQFDEKSQRFIVYTSKLRKVVWIIFHLSSAIIFWTDCFRTVNEIRSSHDTLLYFELMVVLGYFGFDYPFKYKWYFKIPVIQDFFDELQDSPLQKIASPRSFKRAFWYTVFYLWYYWTIFPFFLLHWDVHYWSFSDYYKTLQTACETYYGIPKSWECYSFYPVIIFVGFFLITQHTGFSHCCDLLAISGIVTMNHVARDLDKAMKSNAFSDREIYELIRAQWRLTRKFNFAFGLLVCVYVTYCSPYYSLHAVDMFNVPGNMNRLNTFTYIVVLGVGCKLAIDVIILARRRNRWMVAKNRLLRMERNTFQFFLDDQAWEKFALGSYFEVNSFVTGEIASLLITVAVIRIQM